MVVQDKLGLESVKVFSLSFIHNVLSQILIVVSYDNDVPYKV